MAGWPGGRPGVRVRVPLVAAKPEDVACVEVPLLACGGTGAGPCDKVTRCLLSTSRAVPNLRGMPDLRAALDRISDGIIVYDRAWRITYVNRSAAEYFGQPREALAGKTFAEAFPAAVGTESEELLRRAASGTEPIERETFSALRKRWVAFRAQPSEQGLAVYFRDVTERKQAEDALRESEERHRAVVRHNLAGILFTAPTGEIFAANPAACQLLGRTEEEICAGGRAAIVDASDARIPAFLEARKRDGFARGELTLVHKDGHKIPVELSSAVFRDAHGRERTSMSFVDLTERKRSEEALHLLADAGGALSGSLDLQTTVENLTGLLVPRFADACMVDVVEGTMLHRLAVVPGGAPHGELVETLRRVDGSPPCDAGEGKVLQTGEPELTPVVTDAYMRAAAFSDAHYEAAKALAPRSVLVVPLRVAGQTCGALTLAIVGSGRRFDEADLAVAAQLADRAAVAIEHARAHQAMVAAKQVRDEMLGIVSHDLRNPLNSIGLTAQVLLRRNPGDPELLSIRQSVARADRLIQDLLTAARIEGGNLPVERRPENVRRIIDEVVAVHRPIAEDRSVALDVAEEGDVSEAWVDRHRLTQVLSNLVSNAIRFTPPGGKIQLRARCTAEELRLVVSDTGAGIEKAHLPHIFDRFWQGAQGRQGGAGLGLAIVRGIVTAHEGDIHVESEPGKGTTFTVTMPSHA